jgi:hypothetical protein
MDETPTIPLSDKEKAKVQRTFNQEEHDSVGTLTSAANPKQVTGQLQPAHSIPISSNISTTDTISSFATQMEEVNTRFNNLDATLDSFQTTLQLLVSRMPHAPSNPPFTEAASSALTTAELTDPIRWLGGPQ